MFVQQRSFLSADCFPDLYSSMLHYNICKNAPFHNILYAAYIQLSLKCKYD